MKSVSIRTHKRPSSTAAVRPNQTDLNRTAAQLISDVAAELRAPLTLMRESIQSVHDGHDGSINGQQRSMLDSAIQRCHDLDRMIAKLAQSDHDHSLAPLVQRRGVVVTEIRDAVEQVLAESGVPESIAVLWDGADDPNLSIFADSTLLTRMIVALVIESVRVTPPGGCVLVRLQTAANGDAVRWSVIDQGPGIRKRELRELLIKKQSNSDGLKLEMCQQIAALHFSPLNVYSRIDSGTEISFETPRSGPRSVVAVWSKWRTTQGTTLPDSKNASNPDPGISQQLRFDSAPARVSLGELSEFPRYANRMSVGKVILGATVSRSSADAFDRFLQRQIRMHDLVYRVGVRRWVWVFDDHEQDVGRRIESITSFAMSVIPGIRMNWSRPMMIPVDPRQTNLRLSELLIRNTLSESTSAGLVDKDTVRMGTAPMEPSAAATDRLDEELRRLSGQLKMQSDRMGRQARHLRPRN